MKIDASVRCIIILYPHFMWEMITWKPNKQKIHQGGGKLLKKYWPLTVCLNLMEPNFFISSRLRTRRWAAAAAGPGGRAEARKLRDRPSNPARALQPGHPEENRTHPGNRNFSPGSGNDRQPVRQLWVLPQQPGYRVDGRDGSRTREAANLFRGRPRDSPRSQDWSQLPPDSDQVFAGLLISDLDLMFSVGVCFLLIVKTYFLTKDRWVE